MEKLDINKMIEQIPDCSDEIILLTCFKQVWGTSATAFLEPGYFAPQMMTEAYTTIFVDGERYYVFIDNEFCYSVTMNKEFRKDIEREFIKCRWAAKLKYDNYIGGIE